MNTSASPMRSLRPLLVLSAAIGLPLAASAQFTDNFSSYTTDAVITAPWVPNNNNGGLRKVWVYQDTTNLFGQGTGNRYLGISKTGGTTEIGAGVVGPGFSTAVGQVSFSFYDPNLGSGTSEGLRIRLGYHPSNPNISTNGPFTLYLDDGEIFRTTADSNITKSGAAIATYAQSTVNQLTLVFNNSASSATYDNASKTLASRTMDVWLNGTIVASGIDTTFGSTGALNSIAFNIFGTSGDTNTFYIDDVTLSNTITISSIPEPAHAALGLGVLASGFAFARRRRR